MPVFEVTAPDGRIYEVNGPEGSTAEQAIEYAQKYLAQKTSAFKPSTPNFSRMTTAELEAMPSAPSSLSDIAKSMGIGVVGAGKALTDVFGAGSDLSQYLGETAESLQKGLSPARQAEIAKRQEMVKRAEASGNVFKEIGTQLGGVFEAPLQSASQAVGSSVPSIAAAVATIPLGAPAALATGVGVISRAALGAAQGVGEYKGSVFDAVKQAYKDKGYNDKQAEELAIRAQEYSQNKALELGGSALLGALDSLTGMESGVKKALKKAGKDKITKEAMDEAIGALPEKAIAKPGLLKSAAISAAGEAPVEGAQGGFGQYAENLALIREGLMDPEQAMKGVYGAAARDAAVGALAGTAFTPFTQSARRSDYLLDQAVRQEKASREEEQFQKDISLNEQELPLGYQMQREELGLATVPSGYNIVAAGQDTPLATYATEDEAQSKIELMQQMRGEESASLLAEIEKNGADLKKDQDRLIYLEATGQGKSPEAQTLRENIPVKQSQVDDLSGGIYQRVSDLQAPISVVPGAPTEVMQEQFHITAPDATRFGTFKTVQEARSALQQQIGEEPFKQMQSRKVADAFIKTKLLPQLQKFGLGNVGLQIEQDMEAGGSYSSSLIKLAMDHDNPLSYMPTMRHEAMHALKNLGFFSPQQMKALEQKAEKEWVDTYLKGQNATYEGQTMSRYDAYIQIFTKEAQEKGLSGKDLDNYVKESILEEAIADAFGSYEKGATPPPGMIAALYKKIKNFFANFKQAMQGAGFESADDIFQSIERGQLKPTKAAAAEEKLSLKSPETPEFKQWFGDSKVVDEDGKPLVVYHGTNKKFTVFEGDTGYYTTKNIEDAEGYSMQRHRKFKLLGEQGRKDDLFDKIGEAITKAKSRVMPVYVKMDNPLYIKKGQVGVHVKLTPEDIKEFKSQGYDGIIYNDGEEIVAFDANQIKSATGNIGTYSKESPDIRYSLPPGSDVGHKREISSGRYVGAPDWVGSSPQQLSNLRKKLSRLAKEGENGRYWYENSSKAILDMVGGDKKEAEKIVGLIAIYSPNATVPANTSMALNAYYQYKTGQPINAGFTDADTKAEDLLRHGKEWSGIKTNSFYQNLMVGIDPSKLDPGVATMDMWMALAFDYGMKTLDQGPKYKFAEREIQRLAKELGWDAHQVQAAIWTAMKGRIEPIRDALKAKELEIGIGEMYSKDGKQLYRVKPSRRYDHFRLAHQMGMDYNLRPDDIDQAKYDFSNAINDRSAQMSWEATPGKSTGILPGLHNASTPRKFEYLEAISDALKNKNGGDKIAEKIGMPSGKTIFGFSAWQGDIGAGAQTFMGVALQGQKDKRDLSPEARNLINLYSAIKGYALSQESVVWHVPSYDGAIKNQNGIQGNFNRSLTEEEMETLYTGLHEKFGTWDIAPGYIPDGFRLLNFTDISNKEFHKGVESVLSKLPSDFGGGMLNFVAYRSIGDYIGNDWKTSPRGEDYESIIKSTAAKVGIKDPSDLFKWATNLRSDIEAVNQSFSEKYKWGSPSIKLSLRSDELRQRPSPRGGVVLGEKQQGAVSYTAAHYGNARVDELDASKYGTGLRGAERRRLADSVDPRIRKRAYFYIQKEDGTTPTPEAGVGQYVYTQQFDNILPPGPEMSQLFKDAQGDSNQFESNVIDAGYDGYASPSMGMLVILNHNVPVNYVGPRAEVGVQKLSLKAPTTPEFKRWFGDSKVVEPFDPALKREGMEYEGRLFGGGYSGDRLKTAAKDAPIRKMIAQARIRYNNIREELGLPEVTDWTTKPDYLVQRFNGKPMVMYHGTFQGTDEGGMTIPKTRGNRNAFFVSPDADFASKYALNDLDWYPEKGFGKVPEGAHVYPVYISAKNPFDYENDSHTLKIIPQFRKILREEERHNKNQIEKLIDDFRSGDWSAIEWANNYDLFEKNGFDAFYTKEQGRKNLGVFRPQQIKSATGNLGTYNKESPDIRYSLKNVGFPSVKAAKEAVAKTSVPETSAFKRFIGASQWVDKDGKAKVFYHATAGEFFEFTPAGSSQAIFLAETPEEAETFGSVAEDRVRRQIYKALNKDEKQDLFMRVLAGAVEKGTVSDKQAEEFIRSFKRKTPEYGDFGDIEQETYDALLDLSPSKMTIMPLYARAETPFDFENQDHVRDVINWVANNGDIDKDNPEKWLANLTGRIKQGSWQAIENKDVQRGIRAMGHDGFTIRENKASPKNYAVYQPNQLKSVTGNDGQFSLETGDIRYSLKPLPALSKAETQRLNEVATKRLDEGWVKRLTTSLGPEPFSYIRQKLINRYQRLADLDKAYREWLRQNGGAEMLADQSAENAALMSDLSSGVMAAAMGAGNRKGGIPVYKNGITTIDTSVKGLVQALMPLAEKGNPEIYQRYQFWAGWKRARRMLKEGREKLYEPQDAALAQKFEQMHPEFKQVYDDLNKFNDGLVKYAVQTGVLSKERGDLYMKYGDYIPFYRQLDLDQTIGPNVFHGLAGVKGPTELKGGESGLADFLETMVRNTQSMINAGMKNAAAQVATRNAMQIKMVQRLAGPPLGSYKDDIYSQLENGQQVFYRSHDKLYIDAVKSLNIPEIPFLGFLSGPANLLRNLVTKEPGFMMANLLRDSLSAYVTSGANMTPVIGSAVNFAKGLTTGSPGMEALFNSGLLGGYEFSHNIERSGKHLSNELARKSKTDAAALRPFKSLWEGLERGTTASDAATRVAIYERVLAETGNEAEALSRAMEVMNFNRKGNSALIRILTAAVPFFNARLQGLDVFYRASTGQMNTKDAKEIQRRFWIRGATMAALSVMYYMAASDDDEYKKQEAETKDNNWIVPSLGIKVPIPFEVGTVFKTMPERIYAVTLGDDTAKDFTDSMKRALLSTLGFNPTPQTFKPILEAATNFNFFTWRPIVGKGMEGVAPEYQIGPGTSKGAEYLGQLLGMSPLVIDHIWKGYTGTLGQYITDVADSMLSQNDDSPKASKRFEQMPIIKRFALDPAARGSVTEYYQLKDAVDTTVRTMNLLEKTARPEDFAKYVQKNAGYLVAKDYVRDLDKTMKELREMRGMIQTANMTADEKRDALLAINQAESNLTSNVHTVKVMISQLK